MRNFLFSQIKKQNLYNIPKYHFSGLSLNTNNNNKSTLSLEQCKILQNHLENLNILKEKRTTQVPKYLVFDLETNGLPKKTKVQYSYNKTILKYASPKDFYYYDSSRISELGFILYDENQEKLFEFSNLVYPEDFTQTKEAQEVNNISQEELIAKGLPIKYIFEILAYSLQGVEEIVAHNIDFDYHILLSECYRNQFFQKYSPLLEKIQKIHRNCTYCMAQNLYPKDQKKEIYPQNFKLQTLYNFLKGDQKVQSHRSLDDCFMAAECYFHFINSIDCREKLQLDKKGDYILGFGEYKGRELYEMHDLNPVYYDWVFGLENFHTDAMYQAQYRMKS